MSADERRLQPEPLAPEAALALLTRGVASPDGRPGDIWLRIARWVDYVPLALELLNATLRAGGLDVDELAHLVSADNGVEASVGGAPIALHGVGEAFAVAYAALSPEAQVAALLLAQLAPAPIPVALLEALGYPTSAAQVQASLIDRSFLSRPAEGSVAEMAGMMPLALAGFLRDEAAHAGTDFVELRAVCAALLEVMAPDACQDPERATLMNACVPHAESVLSRIAALAETSVAAAETGASLAVAPDVAASDVASGASPELGQVSLAGVTLGAALGFLFSAQGLPGRARPVEQATLALATATLGSEHPATLAAANNLAETLSDLGDTAGARELHQQVLDVHRRMFGPNHPDTLMSAGNLAAAKRALGDLSGARDLQDEVVRARRRLLGAEHPSTLTAANNLAATLRALGDEAGARALLEQVFEGRRRRLGPEHPSTLLTATNLAEARRASGDGPSARDLLEWVLVIRRRVLGPEHTGALATAATLAATLQALGDNDRARELLEEVLEAHGRLLGAEHPTTTAAAWQLYGVAQADGDVRGADEIVERHLAWLLSADPTQLDSVHLDIARALGTAQASQASQASRASRDEGPPGRSEVRC